MSNNYADKWNNSSRFFYDKGYYLWMCEKIKDYTSVLEVGCGAGYGTLSIAKAGHNVISIEKDIDCINLTEKLLKNNNLIDKVKIVEKDIITGFDIKDDFDIIVCWNPGIGKIDNKFNNYIPYMLRYGLNIDQIRKDYASTYSEYLIWQISRIAKENGVPYHLVDRCLRSHDIQTENYYKDIKEEIGFSRIEIDYLRHWGQVL